MEVSAAQHRRQRVHRQRARGEPFAARPAAAGARPTGQHSPPALAGSASQARGGGFSPGARSASCGTGARAAWSAGGGARGARVADRARPNPAPEAEGAAVARSSSSAATASGWLHGSS